jgi:hypothetical protein
MQVLLVNFPAKHACPAVIAGSQRQARTADDAPGPWSYALVVAGVFAAGLEARLVALRDINLSNSGQHLTRFQGDAGRQAMSGNPSRGQIVARKEGLCVLRSKRIF